MEKLELKYIAGYLPYGIFVMAGAKKVIYTFDYHLNIEGGKPILFPMKCLIEEVTINGETFIPIIELAKLFHKEDAYKVTHYEDPRYMDWGYNGEDAAWVINCCVENDSDRYLYYSIYKHKLNQLPLNLVDKLNELHFDYRGLIDRGLAVSALDYDNPYK